MAEEAGIFSRRRLLGAALAAGGLAATGAAAFLALRGRAPAVAGLRCLSPHEYRTFNALAEALFPRGGAFPPGAADFDLGHKFDAFLADEPSWNQDDLKKALFLLELGPAIFERRLTSFSRLPEGERLAHFRRWAEGDRVLLRTASAALRKFTALVYYDQPPVWPHLGYVGPLLKDDEEAP